MDIIETRLTGRHANLAGITHFINRHLGNGAFERVELRYSTQADSALAPLAAKQAIAALLRENGMVTAAVSVRAHEGPIDDATGEHLVRLYPALQARADGHIEPDTGSGFAGWVARLFAPRAKRRTGALPADAPKTVAPAPRMSNGQAVAHLRAALKLAAAYVETDTGTAIVAHDSAQQHIGEARVTVRLASLHEVLRPLVADDAVRAAQSIQAMLKEHGLSTAPNFSVRYVHLARVTGDGTGYAAEADVEVTLRLAAQGGARVEPRLVEPRGEPCAPARPSNVWHTHAPQAPFAATDQTMLPKGGGADGITVRVLGTMWAEFAQPFELRLPTLPARFDRNALEQAGFGKLHPSLLQVASNRAPLLISRGENGELQLQGGMRALADGAVLPMYSHRSNLAGVNKTVLVPGMDARLVVNAPGGVCDPASGKMVPALVIELVQPRMPTARAA
ncbi:MAG: hypothetical protein V4582_13530 [Pseudomonadota bacterium]